MTKNSTLSIKSAFTKIIAAVLAAMLAVFCVPTSAFADGASISITSNVQSTSVYSVIKIATANARPLTNGFDWSKVLAQSEGLRAKSVDSDLVSEISQRIEETDDVQYLEWLAGFVNRSAAMYQIGVNDGPTEVENGWYICVSPNKVPMFIWTINTAVELQEKADAPYHTHYVKHVDDWTDRAVHGAHSTIPYKIELNVPRVMDQHDTYPIQLNVEWDGNLIYNDGSLRVKVERADGSTSDEDVTDAFKYNGIDNGFVLTCGDLKSLNVSKGDKVVFYYDMHMLPDAPTGTKPMPTMSFVSYPTSPYSSALDGATPTQVVNVHAFKLVVKKIDSTTEETLSGAKFIIRDGNYYMKSDGTFEEGVGNAYIFETDEDGLITDIPVIGVGSYEVVEVESPEGYDLPKVDAFVVNIEADVESSMISFKVSATNGARFESVDGSAGIATLLIPNNKTVPDGNVGDPGDNPGTDGSTVGGGNTPSTNQPGNWFDNILGGTGLAHTGLAQTGDIVMFGLFVIALVAIGAGIFIIVAKKRKNDEA